MKSQLRLIAMFWRVLFAAAICTAAAVPFCEYFWTIFDLHAFDLVTGAHPHYVSAPIPALTESFSAYTWQIYPGLLESLAAGAVAIAIFVTIGGHRACIPRECRCRNCREVLRNLAAPVCPGCGERI